MKPYMRLVLIQQRPGHAGPVTSTFRFIHSTAELREFVCGGTDRAGALSTLE